MNIINSPKLFFIRNFVSLTLCLASNFCLANISLDGIGGNQLCYLAISSSGNDTNLILDKIALTKTDCLLVLHNADLRQFKELFSDKKYDGQSTFFKQPSEKEMELPRLKKEADDANIRQSELEQQLRIYRQQISVSNPLGSVPVNGKRIALVIGNSNYKSHPLKNPKNDADDMSVALKYSGFDVIDLRDASLTQLRAGVRQFGDRLLNYDVGLVYYSGHGIEVKGKNYFVPVNADIQREDEVSDQSLDVSLILEKMTTAGKGVNILIVDACRDDPFGRSFRTASRGLANMDAPSGTIIAYATSPGKVASDGDGRNSPYTKNLLKAMQQPNKPIEQVFKEVRRAVQIDTKNQQTPWENTSLSGDFYFKMLK